MITKSKKVENDKQNFLQKILLLISKISHSKKTVPIIGVAAFLFGLFLRPAIEKSIEFLTYKQLTQKKLCYEIIQTNRYKKYELVKLSEKLGYEKFDLNLDDPILKNYYLIQIKLRNEAECLHGPIKFSLSCDNKYTKIIDIKHKVVKPANKIVKIADTLPSLNWGISEETFLKISWENSSPLSGTAGFSIYRSLDKEVGFGRINEKLIKKMEYKLPFNQTRDLSKNYFRVSTEGIYGVDSGMSEDFICTPEIFAFSSSFKDVIWINPRTKSGSEPDGSKAKPFKSLKEAISKTNKFATFVINQYRGKIISSQNISKEANVFYKDALSFLEGKIEFSILNGFDENAEIDLFILCKISDFNNFGVKLKLIGSPEVIFEEIKRSEAINKPNLQPNTKIKKNIRVLLTPKIVKTYLGSNTIFLAWEIPKSNQYKGVRIFRSVKRNLSDLEKLGEEVYDGIGSFAETFHCRYYQRASIDKDFDALMFKIIGFHTRPPDRKTRHEDMCPQPPSNISIMNDFEVKLPFFEDKNVIPGTVYTYTIYAYDDDNNYSYPILINASLDDWSPKQNCMRSVQ